MNKTVIATIGNVTISIDEQSLNNGSYMLIIMVGLLSSVPLCWCLCYLIRYILRYLNSYGRFTNIISNTSNRQFKVRVIFDCLFGSIASPKLTEIIIYPMIKIESTVVYLEN